MTASWRGPAGLLVVGLLLGCGGDEGGEPDARPSAPAGDGATTESAPATAAKTYDPSTAGSISGRVRYAGAVPAPTALSVSSDPWCSGRWPDGKIQISDLVVSGGFVRDAFVWIESGLDGYEFEPPSEPVELDQVDCMYEPRVVGVQVGQPLWAKSSDQVMHNIHTKPKRNKEKNEALPYPDKLGYRDFEFKRPEVMIEVACDVHAWMKGWIGVTEHPFFAVTGADGSFELAGVPPGDYVVGVWHERLGQQEFKVALGERQTASHDVDF